MDNRSKHTYYYKVSVYTGMRQGAGTESKVYFVVNGENGDTGVRSLTDGDKKVQLVYYFHKVPMLHYNRHSFLSFRYLLLT